MNSNQQQQQQSKIRLLERIKRGIRKHPLPLGAIGIVGLATAINTIDSIQKQHEEEKASNITKQISNLLQPEETPKEPNKLLQRRISQLQFKLEQTKSEPQQQQPLFKTTQQRTRPDPLRIKRRRMGGAGHLGKALNLQHQVQIQGENLHEKSLLTNRLSDELANLRKQNLELSEIIEEQQ